MLFYNFVPPNPRPVQRGAWRAMLWKIAAKTLLLPLNIDSEPPPILPQILSMLRAHVLRVLRGLKLAALIQPSFAGLVG